YLLLIFFHSTPPPPLSTLSLHDALPISLLPGPLRNGLQPARHLSRRRGLCGSERRPSAAMADDDRVSRGRRVRVDRPLGAGRVRSEEHTSESSHQIISYAVFCLKKKTTK